MTEETITKEDFIKQESQKASTGKWRVSLIEALKANPVIESVELFDMTRPDALDRHPSLKRKSISSEIFHMKEDGVFCHAQKGTVYLDSYWDDEKNKPVFINK